MALPAALVSDQGEEQPGMRAWQDTLMVRELQLPEGCCVSLASLQLSLSNDLLTFFLSCSKAIVPSTSILVFHVPLKSKGEPSFPLSQVFLTSSVLLVVYSSPSPKHFSTLAVLCHGVATWHAHSLSDNAP